MVDVTRPSLGTGARGIISGFISNGAAWSEDVEITYNNSFVASADTLTWQLNFREDGGSSVVASFTTTDGDLTIVQNSASTTLQIRVPPDELSDLEGDYIVDLVSQSASDTSTRTHWGHGIITVINEPVWSS